MAITKWLVYTRAWTCVSFFKMLSNRQLTTLRVAVFVLSLLPVLRLIYAGWHDQLGANPLEFITRNTGDWALYFLLATLSITPLRKLSRWNWLIRLRRMLGLYSFFYASLHLLCFIWFDHFFEWSEMVADVLKRPFIWIGMLTWFGMLPLALTSPKFMLRWLGGKRWQMLHRLVYLTACTAVLHYYWMKAGKHDFSQPLIFGLLTSLLLLYRLYNFWQERQVQATLSK